MSIALPSAAIAGGTSMLYRAGQVRDVVAVSFGRGPLAQAPQITTTTATPGLEDILKARLGEELQITRDLLSRALGGEAMLDRHLEGRATQDEQAALNPLQRIGIEIYQTASDALEALKNPPTPTLTEEQREDLVDAAIRYQVDARLAAEDVLKEAELQAKVSVMRLFDPVFGDQMESALRLGRIAERAGQRREMIRDLTADIRRGEVQVSITTATVDANAMTTVAAGENQALTVFSAERYEVGLAVTALRLQAVEPRQLDWRG